MSMFKAAVKEQLKARIAIDGPAGSGKTLTGLLWAMELAGPDGRIAVIDTEHGSARKYAGEVVGNVTLKFDVCELEHYAPSTYTNVIKEAGRLGYDVIIVDSLSHAWEGVGGALDMVDRKSSSTKGGSFAAWKDVTPMHREMVEAILACPCHLIGTMRSKMAYELEEVEEKGQKKTRVTKLGVKPIQREGMEYEFDVVADIDLEHVLTISKTRCPALDGKKAAKPSGSFLAAFVRWLNSGEAPAPEQTTPALPAKFSSGLVLSGQVQQDPHSQSVDEPCGDVMAGRIKAAAQALKITPEKIKEFANRCGVQRITDMPFREAERLLTKLETKAREEGCPF